MRKKLLSVLLAMAMVLGLFPIMDFAYAESTGSLAIRLDTEYILGPNTTDNGGKMFKTPKSYVYFGTDNSGDPIKWRVLDADKANNGSNGIFMLSEYTLGDVVYNSNSSTTYAGSNAQTWCTNLLNNKFSEAERNALLSITKSESGTTAYTYKILNPCGLSGDKVFFLSAKELAEYVANYDSSYLSATAGGNSGNQSWWLRSDSSDQVGIIWGQNQIIWLSLTTAEFSARPATNLDKTKILFTSAAEGSKLTSTVDGTLTSTSDMSSSSEWKLTLKDTSRSLNVSEGEAKGAAGDTISLNFSGATYTGGSTNEYISAMLVDGSNNVLYYGRVKQLTSNGGTVNITIPEDIETGNYTLKLFNEQYNGNYKTDYASDFKDVSLTVTSDEAKIGNISYATIGEALDAASSNDTADTIEIIKESVTAVDDKVLKAGDSIKTYSPSGNDSSNTLKATTDAKLNVDAEGNTTFTSGKLAIVDGASFFSGTAVAIGNSGKEITLPASTDKTIWVMKGRLYGTDATAVDTDTVMAYPGGNVKIGDTVYENAKTGDSYANSMTIVVTKNNGNTLYGGSVNLDKNGEIYLDYDDEISIPIKNTGDKAITVTSEDASYEYYDTVTVPAGGKVKIGSKEYEAGDEDATFITIANAGEEFDMNGQTYTTVLANTTFSIDSEGNAQLVGGGIELDDDESIVGAKGKLITNPADPSEDKLIVTVEDGNDVITIPTKDGKVKIDDTEYDSAVDNTKIVVDDNGNNLISGGAQLDDDKSIIGIRGKLITNPADSSEDILVVTVEDGKDVITIPAKNGKVKIADTEYEAAADNTKMVVGEKGNIVSEGAVILDDGESIIGGGSGQTFTNPAGSGKDQITLMAKTPTSDKDTIIVPAGGKVKIGGKEYVAGAEGVTLVVGTDGKVSVSAGSLKSVENTDKDNNGTDGSGSDSNDADDSDSSSKTGDDTNVLGLLALLALAGAGAGTVFIRRRHN